MSRGYDYVQRARLASGCILYVFITTHLLNAALGNISLDAMEAGRRIFTAVWRNPAGTTLLAGAFAVHAALVLYALYRRRRLAMPPSEAVQIVFGLIIPFVAAVHILGTRGAHEVFGVNDTYAYVVLSLWVWDWQQGLLQTFAVLIAWVHGCLGLYFWLRLKPWFAAWRSVAFAFALLVPTLALAGFASAGKEAAILARSDAWLQAQVALMDVPPGAAAWVYGTADRVRLGALLIVAGVLVGRQVRIWLESRKGRVTVGYPDGSRVTVDLGSSVLEASRVAGIEHASVCGGRGRCSTCRVRVIAGRDELPPPSQEEQRVLNRIGAPANVRLACQLRPTGDVAVIPLLPATAQPKEGFRRPGYLHGSEREIAILFADLRAFTKFSESKLPYDVVFVVNQYCRTMGSAVEAAGGQLDKFIGDGVMALFGIESGPRQGCREALNAARAMALGLAELNRQLKADLREPLRMGIGIHVGHAIVGEMGYRNATSVTAIGDAVNTASRLETMSKELDGMLIISAAVAEQAGLVLDTAPRHQVRVRGRAEALTVLAIADPTTLPELDGRPATAATAAALGRPRTA